jgi:hypothetical protein
MPSSSDESYFVYMTASKPRGVIYTGMTSDLAGRAWHTASVCWMASRNAIGSGGWFTTSTISPLSQPPNANT